VRGDRIRYGVIVRIRDRPRLAQRVLGLVRRLPVRGVRSRLARWFSWLLVDELPAQLEVRTIAGTLAVDTRDTVGRVLAVAGEWEPHVTRAFLRSLRPGDVCLDVGAHVGYYTLLASKAVGRHGHVYAFEPAPGVYRVLSRNLERSGVANVTALNVAAGASEGSAVLYEGPGGGSGNSSLSPRLLETPHMGRAEQYTPVEVEVRPVDALVPPDMFSRVRMIKVDVEGYEVEAICGLEDILAEGAPVSLIVELSPEWSEDDPARFVEKLCERHGLNAFRLVNEYSLDGYFPTRIEPATRLDEIPAGRCDLLLVRGRG
jgi:FkbM family methyltransferase